MIEANEQKREGSQELSFRYPLQVLLRHKKKILGCFLVLGAITFAMVLTRQDIYRSEAKLLVQIGRESISLDPTASMGPIVDLRQDRDQELRAELAILQSPDLCRQVVQSIGPRAILDPPASLSDGEGGESKAEKSWVASQVDGVRALVSGLRGAIKQLLPGVAHAALPEEEEAFLRLREGLDIDLMEESSVLSASYEAPDPALAQRILVDLIEGFQEKHLAVHRTPGSYEFFADQSEKLAGELETAERELQALRTSSGFASVEDQRRVLFERLASVRTDLGATEAGIAFSRAKAGALRELLSGLEDTVVFQERVTSSNPTAEHLRQRINELKLQEQQALRDFNEESRQLQGLRAQIEVAEALLEPLDDETVERTQGPNVARQQLQLSLMTEEASVTSLQSRLESLLEQEAELTAEMARMNEFEFELSRLMRTIRALEGNYQRYAEGFEQVRVSQALEMEKISNIRVIQPPSMPLESEGRGRAFFLALGLFASLVGALSLGFVSEALDRTIKTKEEARDRLRLPTLASIPNKRALRDPRRWRPVRAGEPSPNGAHEPRAEFAELGDLVQALGRSSGSNRMVLGLTSAQRGEGVSTVSAHLAAALARRSEGPVLLVDAVLGNPTIHRTFHVLPSPGLAECLSGAEPRAQSTSVENLWVLSAGRTDPSRPQPVSGSRLQALLEGLREEYDLVLVDLPAVSDGAVRLAASCDAVLLVVQAERHPRQLVEHGRDLLQSCGASLMGTILNARRHTLPGWLQRSPRSV